MVFPCSFVFTDKVTNVVAWNGVGVGLACGNQTFVWQAYCRKHGASIGRIESDASIMSVTPTNTGACMSTALAIGFVVFLFRPFGSKVYYCDCSPFCVRVKLAMASSHRNYQETPLSPCRYNHTIFHVTPSRRASVQTIDAHLTSSSRQ